ncbi:hypothetical protein T4A_12615, partial [Trichinella pseudospiralis]
MRRDRGRHEAEQKEDKRYMRFPVGPNSVSLGLGYFERVKLSHRKVNEAKKVREGFNALKTGFRRCIMQITIAIK